MSESKDREVIRIAAIGMNQLEKATQKFKPEKWYTLERRAVQLACRLFFVAEYASRRGAAGCGDSGHEDAMKHANIKFKKARKLAGYTYP